MPKEWTKSEKWADEIVHFSSACGPAVVSAALDISREEAADRLMELGSGKDGMSTHISHIQELLQKPYFNASINQVGMQRGRENGRIKLSDKFFTVAEWLRINRDKVAIIRAADHFMYVAFGLVIEDNGYAPRKGRVTHVIYLNMPTCMGAKNINTQ